MDKSTQTPEWPIESFRKTPSLPIIAEIVHDLTTDNPQSHNDIREYIEAFRGRLYQLERMQPNWEVSQELRQLLFLENLGPSFSDFRGYIYQCYKVAGCGDGPELTLDQLMEKAEDEWHRLRLEKKLSQDSGSPSSGYTAPERPTKRPNSGNSQGQLPKRVRSQMTGHWQGPIQ